MTITFLYHSSFLVELNTCALLFDWYGGPLPEWDREKPLYVFSSHHHGDHYSPQIFSALGMENVWYVPANCIRLSAKRKAALGILDDHVFRLAPGRTLSLGPLAIETLPSTDAGVAFLIRCEGKTLFHAGDLNWWTWEGEPTEQNRRMERDFKTYCKPLEGVEVDAAFLVLDPRQEEDYWLGFDWLLRTMRAKAAFPMHCWEEFTLARRWKADPRSLPYRESIREVRYNGQQFTL